jgi:hypothetical protein
MAAKFELKKGSSSGRHMIVHNIGQRARMEDVLLTWKGTGRTTATADRKTGTYGRFCLQLDPRLQVSPGCKSGPLRGRSLPGGVPPRTCG